MGLTSVEIEIGNASNLDVTEKVDFLVDSGAFYSVVPSGILEKLGIKPVADEIFRLANGEAVRLGTYCLGPGCFPLKLYRRALRQSS